MFENIGFRKHWFPRDLSGFLGVPVGFGVAEFTVSGSGVASLDVLLSRRWVLGCMCGRSGTFVCYAKGPSTHYLRTLQPLCTKNHK